VPIPTPGVQLVTLSHVEDVASMLAAVPGNSAAIRQHYNICSDRQISFVGECCCCGSKAVP
jgi:nucleoside-diphosphate-sugar epimerase